MLKKTLVALVLATFCAAPAAAQELEPGAYLPLVGRHEPVGFDIVPYHSLVQQGDLVHADVTIDGAGGVTAWEIEVCWRPYDVRVRDAHVWAWLDLPFVEERWLTRGLDRCYAAIQGGQPSLVESGKVATLYLETLWEPQDAAAILWGNGRTSESSEWLWMRGTVYTARCIWDVTGDGVRDIADVMDCSARYGAVRGDDDWSPWCDREADGIWQDDLAAVRDAYGEPCP